VFYYNLLLFITKCKYARFNWR